MCGSIARGSGRRLSSKFHTWMGGSLVQLAARTSISLVFQAMNP